MMRFLGMLMLCCLSFFLAPAAFSQAQPGASESTTTDSTGTTGSGNAATGGQCDFTAVKDSLYKTESGGSQPYTVIGKTNTRYGLPLGKYQFIPPTQATMIQRNPQCVPAGVNCSGNNILTQPCWQTQECLMDALLAENLDRMRKDADCKAIMGQTITGKQITSRGTNTQTCQITESGLLAAMHLGGNDVCRNLRSGACGGQGDFDGAGGGCTNQGTSEAFYTCKHGGLAVPGQCTPAPYDSQTAAPTLTQQQLEVLDGQGDTNYVETGSNALLYWWVNAFMRMAEQFTANMAMQVQAVGMLFDAKHQLETQRLFQERTAEAHKDYQVSEQMCTFGTFTRDLVATSRSAALSRNAFSTQLMQRELGSGHSKGLTAASDSLSRIALFRKKFCAPGDNKNGLKLLCPQDPPAETQNLDIDYTRTVDQKLSLDINLIDPEVTLDEEAVFALMDNLFVHDPMPRPDATKMDQRRYQYYYHNLRSLMAMRGIARNSIANIIALKTATPNKEQDNATAGPFMRSLLKDLGLSDDEVRKMIGENPSYDTVMKFLTKLMYQNPTFYTNLYDKPANVERIRAAMEAIKVMQDRDILAALQRREMLLSLMLEIRLRKQADDVYSATYESIFNDAGLNAKRRNE